MLEFDNLAGLFIYYNFMLLYWMIVIFMLELIEYRKIRYTFGGNRNNTSVNF